MGESFINDFCKNLVFCEVHSLTDPSLVPSKPFWPYALWYSGFVFYLFTHNVMSSLGFVLIWRAIRTAVITIVAWSGVSYFETLLKNFEFFNINLLSDWLDIVIVICSIVVAYLFVIVFDLPRLSRNTYNELKVRDKENYEQKLGLLKNLKYNEWDYRLLLWKNRSYLYLTQYFVILAIYLGIPLYSLYFPFQLVAIIIYIALGYRTSLEVDNIWKGSQNHFFLFVGGWILIFFLVCFPMYFTVEWTQFYVIGINFIVILTLFCLLILKIGYNKRQRKPQSINY